MATYQVETDNGTYQVETEELQQPKPSLMSQIGQITKQAYNITPMGMATQSLGVAQEGANYGGEKLATGLASHGVDPRIAAGAGTAVQMAPDIMMSLNPGSQSPEIANALKTAGRGVGDVVGSNVGKLRDMARIMTGPGEAAQNIAASGLRNAAGGYIDQAQMGLEASKQIPEALSQAKQELPQLQAKMVQLTGQREGLVAKAGKNIQSLEEPLGSLESEKIVKLVSDPIKASKRLQQLTNIASKGSDYVAENMTASDIRLNRQFVQEMAKNPEVALQGAQASQLNTTFGEAMDKHIPGYKDALDMYKTASQALEDVPNIKAQEVGALRSKIKQMSDNFTNSKLDATINLKKAQLNAKQIMQKADMMVEQGKLSDVYRNRLYKGIIATGILGGASKIANIVGGH